MASASTSTLTISGRSAELTAPAVSTATSDDGGTSGEKAIEACMRSWNYAYKKQCAAGNPNDYECKKAGNIAFLRNTPPLAGYKNICDFIACINFASMMVIVTHKEATHYLANAKIALSAIYHKPKPTAVSSYESGFTRSVDESNSADSSPRSAPEGGN